MKPRPTSPRPALRALAGAGALTATVGLTGCAALSEQTTDLQYDPADGVSASVGPVTMQDLLVVASKKGESGRLSGMAVNAADAEKQLSVSAGSGGGKQLKVPAQGAVRLDGATSGNSIPGQSPTAVTLPAVDVEPGRSMPITFSTPGAGDVTVQVPVILDQSPYGDTEVEHTEAPSPAEGEGEGGGH